MGDERSQVGWVVWVIFVIFVVAGIFGILYALAVFLGGIIGPPIGPYLPAVVIVMGAVAAVFFLLHLIGIKVFRNDGGPGPTP